MTILIVYPAVPSVAATFQNGQSASIVIGQPNFTTGTGSTTQNGLSGPYGIAFDSSGNLWVADHTNQRVLRYAPPFSTGEPASLVIGQSSFTTNAAATTANGFSGPYGVAFDSSGNLWVGDQGNNRVLRFSPPFSNGESASLVLGQSSFTTSVGATTQSGLWTPSAVTFDAAGNLWVADINNHRVVEFSPSFSNGQSASVVIGQPNFTSRTCAFTQSIFCLGEYIALDSSGDLWVSELTGNRVLRFSHPFSNGQSASLVIGQSSFTTTTPATTQNGLREPLGITFNSVGDLWVADFNNNRTLRFSPPFSNGQSASLVIGQSSFTTAVCALTQTGECGTNGVGFDSSGNLWVSEYTNSRVLEFQSNPRTTSGTVSCSPNPVNVGSSTSCTATVSDTSTTPTTPIGTVAFTSTGAGSFTPSNTCTLSGTGPTSMCSVTWTATNTGGQTISASYAGDIGHTGNSGSTTLTVTSPSVGGTLVPTDKLGLLAPYLVSGFVLMVTMIAAYVARLKMRRKEENGLG